MYSPPPMDGFSPPPMSDFSPPPLSDMSPIRDFPPSINGFNPGEEEDEDIIDDDLDLPISDEQFDLTGLSDKINSLELNKINNLPPREILELQKESSQHMIISETAIDIEKLDEVCEKVHSKPSIDNDIQAIDQSSDITPPPEVEDTVIVDGYLEVRESEEDTAQAEQMDENPGGVVKNEDESKEGESSKDVEIEDQFEESPPKEKPHFDIESSKEPDHDIEDQFEEEKSKTEEPPFKSSIQLNVVHQVGEDDNWGDFAETKAVVEENSNWGNFESIPACNDVGASSDNRDIEFDDSDDEFGDFGEVTEAAPDQAQSLTASEQDSIVKSLELLSEKSEELLQTVFASFITNEDSDKEDNGDVGEELVSVVMKENSVFKLCENPCSCPALELQWRDSASYNVIMNTLGIDSRVLV